MLSLILRIVEGVCILVLLVGFAWIASRPPPVTPKPEALGVCVYQSNSPQYQETFWVSSPQYVNGVLTCKEGQFVSVR